MIRTHARDHIVVVRPEGEWDTSNATELAQALAEASDGRHPIVVVDMSGVSFMDLTGARPLLTTAQVATASGIQLFVVRPRRSPEIVLDVLGLGDLVVAPQRVPFAAEVIDLIGPDPW